MAQHIYLTRRNQHFHYPPWFFISSPEKQRKVYVQDQLKSIPMCCTPMSSSESHWQPNTRRSHRRGTGSAERTLRSHTHDTDFLWASLVLTYFTNTWSAHYFLAPCSQFFLFDSSSLVVSGKACKLDISLDAASRKTSSICNVVFFF